MAGLLVLFTFLMACSEYGLHPITPGLFTDLDPDIAVYPEEIDFGEVFNEKRTATIIVTNEGEGILDIEDVQLTSYDSYILEETGDTVLWPGKSTEVVVSFTPIDNNVHNSKVLIVSNDPDEPWEYVNLVGEGVVPIIEVTPLTYDFGTLEAGCEDSEMFQITNVGSADLVVTNIQDSTNDGDLVIDKLSFPLTIKPTEVIRFNAVYRPVEGEQDFGTLFIDSSDPNKPTVQVTLDGTGVVAGYGLDTFVQPETRKTDIVFALDRSCSMGPDLSAVEANFTSFLSSLSSVNADYNIGIAIADDGCFSGGVWLDPTQTYVDQLLILNEMIYGATAFPGNYTERAFNLFEAALNPTNLGTGDCNEGFLRDDALLALIGISDEDDQSYDYWLDYVLYFQGLKADPADVVFHAIGGPPPSGCETAMYYSGMYEAVAWTAGQFISICEPDYSAALTAIAEGSVNVMTAFPLSNTPIPETIVVRIDGVVEKSGWNYDFNSNEVVFQTNYIPNGGSFIEIEYTIAGDCS